MLSEADYIELKGRLRAKSRRTGRKLTEPQRDAIVRDFLAGSSVRELATKYGVTPGGVRYVLWSRAASAAKVYERPPA